jgi:hypothetical protein
MEVNVDVNETTSIVSLGDTAVIEVDAFFR